MIEPRPILEQQFEHIQRQLVWIQERNPIIEPFRTLKIWELESLKYQIKSKLDYLDHIQQEPDEVPF